MNDFYLFPSFQYLIRSILLAAIQASIGFGVVYVLLVIFNLGFSSDQESFIEKFKFQTQSTIEYTIGRPAVCEKPEQDQSQFEKDQCKGFEFKLLMGWVILLIPVLLVYISVSFYTRKIRRIYQAGANSLSHNPAMGRAVVTSPAVIHSDTFAKIYCLKAVSVEMQNKTQEVVYFPLKAYIPEPGQKVIVYELGKFSGENKLTAQVYTPGVTVYKGS